jgi:hypothetical protein
MERSYTSSWRPGYWLNPSCRLAAAFDTVTTAPRRKGRYRRSKRMLETLNNLTPVLLIGGLLLFVTPETENALWKL